MQGRAAPRRGPESLPEVVKGIWPFILVSGTVLQWWFFNIVVIIGNKWIFQKFLFVFPMTLTAVHFVVSYLGALFCIKVLRLSSVIEVKKEDRLPRILPLAIITCVNIVLGNVSLRYIPVSFVQTIKALTPAATVLLQATLWGKKYHYLIYTSLVPVVGGMVMASVNELSFDWYGFIAAMTSVFVTAASTIVAELLLSGKYKFDALNTVYHMIPYSIGLLVVPALLFEGGGVARYVREPPAGGVLAPALAIVASGVLAFGLNFSLYAVIKVTSAVTYCVVGNFKVAVAVFSSWLVFRNPMSALSILGCSITIGGCTYYGYLQQRLGAPPQAKAPTTPPPDGGGGEALLEVATTEQKEGGSEGV